MCIHTYLPYDTKPHYHSITLHYLTFYSIPFHYIILHWITLHSITLHYIALHYITLHYINVTLHYMNVTLHTSATAMKKKPKVDGLMDLNQNVKSHHMWTPTNLLPSHVVS